MATLLAGSRGRIFREKDLQLLLELVGLAAAKWKEVGLALGFLMSELKEIETTVALANGGPEACFTEMLSRWLDWAPPNHPLPSSDTLAEALRSKTVRKERLAYDLEQYFNQTDTATVKSPSIRKPFTFGQPDTQHTVMVESPPTPKPMSDDKLRWLQEWWLQDYVGHDELCVECDEGCLRIHAGLNEDSRTSLVERYSRLTKSVKEALEKKGITAEAIINVLLRQSWDEGKAFMESILQQGDEIQRAADIQELLAAVTSRSTFLDYKPLEHLIKTFKLTEVEEELERYKKDLQQFLRENIPHTNPLSRKRRREESEPETEKKKMKRRCSVM